MVDKELSEDDLVNLVCESGVGNHFIQNDTNVERALRFQRDINRCLAQYEEVYKDLTKNSKQLLITDFITISHNVNISAPNIESAQITSSDESEFKPSIPKLKKKQCFRNTLHILTCQCILFLFLCTPKNIEINHNC